MALISCAECGKEVSDKASSCPNCGAPISDNNSVVLNSETSAKTTRAGTKYELIGFILMLVGMLALLITFGTNNRRIENAVNISMIIMFATGFFVALYGRFRDEYHGKK